MKTRAKQRGYLLVTVVMGLFLLAAIALMLNHDSAISANTTSKELETARVDYVAAAGMQHALWRAQNNACMGDVTIPDTPLGADTYTATITGAASGTLFELAAEQDAWIRSDDITRNNGTTVTNHIRQEAGNVEQVLTRFDLTTVPAGAQINSAIAWFHLKALKPHPQGAINVHEVTADWAEAAVTWESFAESYRGERIAVIPAQDAGDEWVAINLTGLVQAWVNGQPNFGILFDTQAEGVHTEYTAREDGTNPPRLEVVVGSGPASAVTINATGRLDNSVEKDLDDRNAIAYQPQTWTALQPDASGTDDSWTTAVQASWSYGAHDALRVQPGNQRTLLRMDIQGLVPMGARISKATLELYADDVGQSDGIDVHKIRRSWTEGSCAGNCGPDDGATWDTYDGANSWGTAGGDIDTVAVATAVPLNVGDWVSWDITNLVAEWVTDPSSNFGVMFKGNPGRAAFRSSDNADSALRPRISIRYACECGTACMPQTGSGNILMVVINPTTLVAEDQKAKDLFESWGYTVSVISESASQSSYDSAVAANDVVFISETVNSNTVGSKLAGATIGVVSQDGDYNPDLGLATDSALKVGADIDVTSTDHYITSPFRVGALPIYNAGMEQLVTSGALTAGQQTLAQVGGAASLVVLDKGDALEGGGSAAGRRVVLPLGTRYRFDWDRLNANGRLIVQRALSWGMGAGKTSVGKLLLVIGDAANPAPRDADKKALIEGWGYAVTLIDDGAGEPEFKDAMLTTDVVYVSGTVNAGGFLPSLSALPTPLVNEERDLKADYGFSENEGYNVTYSTLTTDSTHYITEPFAGSDVIAFNSNILMWTLNGTISGDLSHVAQMVSAVTVLATLDNGARGWDGLAVPARRVQVPFENADVSDMTAEGQTLMKRSIEWASMPPGGSEPKKVLFVVGSVGGAGLTTEELAHQSLIESWGYTVEIIDDGASQADFDVAVANNDVVFITNDVTASSVDTKLVDATIGIVTSEDNLSDEFGMASSIAWESGTDLEINDNTHFITLPFPLGLVTYSTANESLAYVTGTLSPDLGQLASSSSGYGIVTLDAGASMFGGGSTAGRRAQLPWGGNGFDPNNLTADGVMILQRALEWAAGAGAASTGPIAHWKLDETSGTTAFDSEGGHDGVVSSGSWESDGIIDGARRMPGNANIRVPHDDALILNEEFTMSAWVTAISTSGYRTIINKGTSGANQDYWFGVWNNWLTLGFYTGGGFQYVEVEMSDWNPSEPTHFAASFDNANDTIKLYKNGALIKTGATPYEPPPGTEDLIIGRSQLAEFWNGLIDDVRIYDRVLDDDEVAELAASGGGLVAHWKLDDGTGLTAVDSAGGHDGTLANGPVWVVGQLGDALRFDGSNDRINVPDDNGLDLVARMTLSAWIYSDNLSAFKMILTKGDNGVAENYWLGTDGNKLNFGFVDGGTYYQYTTSGLSLETGRWHHVAATYEDATNEVKLYVDGASESFIAGSSPTPNDEQLIIGSSYWGGESFDGLIDDVRIYNVVLDSGEIASLVSGGGDGGGGGGGGPAPVFESFSEASAASNVTSLNIPKPGGTSSGDLLIAALATDDDSGDTFSPPSGWTEVNVGKSSDNRLSFGVWWKIATSSEPAEYSFNWSGGEEAYGWISRFTGHDASSPIYYSAGALNNTNTTAPICQRLNTPVDNMLVLRLGGFDDDDITIGNPGLDGHTPINMNKSGTGNGTVSGGSGYLIQATAGDSGLGYFQLTRNEQMRTVTLGIRPAE